jgi:hypothetical protein
MNASCILPNVSTVAIKRLNKCLRDERDCECTRSQLGNKEECDSDTMIPSLQLEFPTPNDLRSTNHTPLLEFENGKALTILPGLFLRLELLRNTLP